MTDRTRSITTHKSDDARTPADARLLDARQSAGSAHAMVARAGGGALHIYAPAVDQAIAGVIPDYGRQFNPAPAQKAEKRVSYQDARVSKLGLPADAEALMDQLIAETRNAPQKPIYFTVSRASDVLGISPERVIAAKDELERRNLIRAATNSLGGPDGYRVAEL